MSDEADAQLALPLDAAPEADLPRRLLRLGLPARTTITLTRNRSVLVSYGPATGLRLHAGYAWAGDDVLAAIVTFLKPRASRAERLEARRRFLRYPVERYVPSHRRRRPPPESPELAPLVERLVRLHQILNERHFGGRLATIPLRFSTRMASRLGEYQAAGDGHAAAIVLSHRHLRRDGWSALTETLLHEMVHQWQDERGMPLDHGAAFRRKAREIGIPAAATVRLDTLRRRG